MDSVMLANAKDLCSLLRCALRGETPADWEEMDLPGIWELSKKQSLGAMAYMGLEGSPALDALDAQVRKQWQQERDMAIRKNMLFTAERQRILSQLTAAGIWHMPLKGSILADYYPRIGMRQMSDNDILFDPRRREDVRDIMLALGYSLEEKIDACNDTYLKPPVYNFEMHFALFSDVNATGYSAYYADIGDRLLQGEGLRRRFREEDFYLYFLAHGYKHFQFAGTGLKILVDCQVYLEKMGDKLDRGYLATELEKLKLTEFETIIRTMARKLFVTGETLDAREERIFVFCTQSGAYGTFDQCLANQVRRMQPDGKPITLWTRLRYLWRRLWPDQHWFENHQPFYARHRLLKPVFLVKRLLKGIFRKNDRIRGELKALDAKDRETPI